MIITFDLDQSEADRIDTVFAGGEFMQDRQDVIDGLAQHAADYLSDVLQHHAYLAITGAMRWPWSREATIESRRQFRYV